MPPQDRQDPRADDSAPVTRPMSLWPDQAQPLDSQQAGFVMTSFDPQQAERQRRSEQMAQRLAVCAPGLSLKLLAVLQAGVALLVLVSSQGWRDAAVRWPGPAVAVLAASLAWLAWLCAWRPHLMTWAPAAAGRGAVALGGVCALAGWALVAALGLTDAAGWSAWPAVLAGMGLAALTWYWLGLREAAGRPVEANARLAELQSRIRPHFLFNALNTALALVQVDPERAEAVLEDLSALFRAALAETGAAVTLDDELDLAQRYLAIEKIRFAHRLHLSWDLDPAAGQARLPPLVLQPLVENAVRHGVEPAAVGGGVVVRTRALRGMAELEVINTLPDEPGEPGAGMALANVRERLRLLHDVAAELHTWVEDGQHHARITVPL